jgi:plasmid stabilization system protein ParE
MTDREYKMDSYKVKWAKLGKIELDNIIRYISKQMFMPMTAEKMLKTIYREADKLSYMAKGYPIAYKRLKYRKMIAKNYLIFYSINEKENTVFIERIMHGRRDWKRHLRKSK